MKKVPRNNYRKESFMRKVLIAVIFVVVITWACKEDSNSKYSTSGIKVNNSTKLINLYVIDSELQSEVIKKTGYKLCAGEYVEGNDERFTVFGIKKDEDCTKDRSFNYNIAAGQFVPDKEISSNRFSFNYSDHASLSEEYQQIALGELVVLHDMKIIKHLCTGKYDKYCDLVLYRDVRELRVTLKKQN